MHVTRSFAVILPAPIDYIYIGYAMSGIDIYVFDPIIQEKPSYSTLMLSMKH